MNNVTGPVWKQQWFIRKVVYILFSVVSLLLAGKGALDADAQTALSDLVEPVVSLISALVFALAGFKTNSMSDEKEVPEPKSDQILEGLKQLLDKTEKQTNTITEEVRNTVDAINTSIEANDLLLELRKRLDS